MAKKIENWEVKSYLDLSTEAQLVVEDWIEEQDWLGYNTTGFWDTDNDIFIGETHSSVWDFLGDDIKKEIFE